MLVYTLYMVKPTAEKGVWESVIFHGLKVFVEIKLRTINNRAHNDDSKLCPTHHNCKAPRS